MLSARLFKSCLLPILLCLPLMGCELSLFEGFKAQDQVQPSQPEDDAPDELTCPAEFSLVGANTSFNTQEFCIAKYEMKAALSVDGSDVLDTATAQLDATTHSPESRAHGIPWVRINFATARSECSSLGPGYRMIKLLEWEAVARDLESQAGNWSGEAVGVGAIPSGHSDGAIDASAIADGLAVTGYLLLGSSVDGDSFEGTGETGAVPAGRTYTQKRKLILASGDEVWDIAGNAREWVDVDGNGSLIDFTGPGASAFLDLNSADFSNFLNSIVLTIGGAAFPIPAFGTLDSGSTHGMHNIGRFYVASGARTGAAITRGGNFSPNNSPGIFAGDTDTAPTATSTSVTFRCVYSD